MNKSTTKSTDSLANSNEQSIEHGTESTEEVQSQSTVQSTVLPTTVSSITTLTENLDKVAISESTIQSATVPSISELVNSSETKQEKTSEPTLEPTSEPTLEPATKKLLDFEIAWDEIDYDLFNPFDNEHEIPDLKLYTLASIRKVAISLQQTQLEWTWDRYRYQLIYLPNKILIDQYCNGGKMLNMHRQLTRQNVRLTAMILKRKINGHTLLKFNFLKQLYTLLTKEDDNQVNEKRRSLLGYRTRQNNKKYTECFESNGNDNQVHIDVTDMQAGNDDFSNGFDDEYDDWDIKKMDRQALASNFYLAQPDGAGDAIYDSHIHNVDHFLGQDEPSYSCLSNLKAEVEERNERLKSLGLTAANKAMKSFTYPDYDTYSVSALYCTCPDFHYRRRAAHNPCKHMKKFIQEESGLYVSTAK